MTRTIVQTALCLLASVIAAGMADRCRADIIASNSLATVYLDVQPSPTDGFFTFTFSVEAASMMEVGTIEAEFIASSMNQINPLGLPTIFTDNNAAIAFFGEDPQSDSQFEFSTFADDLLVDSSAESDSLLAADFTGFEPFTAARPIAHIVLPFYATGIANLTFAVRPIGQVEGQAAVFNNIAFGPAIPEVGSFLMGSVLLVGVLLHGANIARRQRARAPLPTAPSRG